MKRISKSARTVKSIVSCLGTIIAFVIFTGNFFSANGQVNSKKEYIYLNGRLIAVESSDEVPGGPIPTPILSYAKVYQGSQVEVRFCSNDYIAANFEIERIPGGITEIDGGDGCISWYDTSVSYGATYAYRVRAKDSLGSVGDYSNRDIATVMTFTDDPISPGSTIVKAIHYNELRQAVSSVRTCAGLGSPTWTDPSLSQLIVKAVHLTEIRNKLNEALDSLAVSRPTYTDGTIVAGSTVIKAAHVQEVREKVK